MKSGKMFHGIKGPKSLADIEGFDFIRGVRPGVHALRLFGCNPVFEYLMDIPNIQ